LPNCIVDEEINAELRYLTLELMKMSILIGKPFKKVVREFVHNVRFLKRVIEEEGRIEDLSD